MSKDAMTGDMDHALSNLGPHPGSNAALQRDVIKLESGLAKLQKRVAELEAGLDSMSESSIRIEEKCLLILDKVRLLPERLNSLR